MNVGADLATFYLYPRELWCLSDFICISLLFIPRHSSWGPLKHGLHALTVERCQRAQEQIVAVKRMFYVLNLIAL